MGGHTFLHMSNTSSREVGSRKSLNSWALLLLKRILTSRSRGASWFRSGESPIWRSLEKNSAGPGTSWPATCVPRPSPIVRARAAAAPELAGPRQMARRICAASGKVASAYG